jgi:protein-S-isoprenylcysteine O-methyltransferase Ste14
LVVVAPGPVFSYSGAVRVAIFLAASGAFILLSWRPLRDLRSHGFYRFFAFEFLSALILLNAPVWFRDPLSARQLVSWFLGAVSIGLAIEGFRLLRAIGRPAPTATRSANLAFENTTTLVTVGAYRLIRHPLYASLLALVWCAYLKEPLAIGGMVLALSASGFLIATAVAEERENLKSFGAPYAAYMKRTRRFVPFVF